MCTSLEYYQAIYAQKNKLNDDIKTKFSSDFKTLLLSDDFLNVYKSYSS